MNLNIYVVKKGCIQLPRYNIKWARQFFGSFINKLIEDDIWNKQKKVRSVQIVGTLWVIKIYTTSKIQIDRDFML